MAIPKINVTAKLNKFLERFDITEPPNKIGYPFGLSEKYRLFSITE